MWPGVQADLHKPIKHFRPRFPPESDPSLAKASALFAAFAFQKGSAPAAPAGSNGHHAAGAHRHACKCGHYRHAKVGSSKITGLTADAEVTPPQKQAAPTGEEVSASGQDRKRAREEELQPEQAAPSSDQTPGDEKTTHIGGPTTTLRASGSKTASLYKRPKPRGRTAPADEAENG